MNQYDMSYMSSEPVTDDSEGVTEVSNAMAQGRLDYSPNLSLGNQVREFQAARDQDSYYQGETEDSLEGIGYVLDHHDHELTIDQRADLTDRYNELYFAENPVQYQGTSSRKAADLKASLTVIEGELIANQDSLDNSAGMEEYNTLKRTRGELLDERSALRTEIQRYNYTSTGTLSESIGGFVGSFGEQMFNPYSYAKGELKQRMVDLGIDTTSREVVRSIDNAGNVIGTVSLALDAGEAAITVLTLGNGAVVARIAKSAAKKIVMEAAIGAVAGAAIDATTQVVSNKAIEAHSDVETDFDYMRTGLAAAISGVASGALSEPVVKGAGRVVAGSTRAVTGAIGKSVDSPLVNAGVKAATAYVSPLALAAVGATKSAYKAARDKFTRPVTKVLDVFESLDVSGSNTANIAEVRTRLNAIKDAVRDDPEGSLAKKVKDLIGENDIEDIFDNAYLTLAQSTEAQSKDQRTQFLKALEHEAKRKPGEEVPTYRDPTFKGLADRNQDVVTVIKLLDAVESDTYSNLQRGLVASQGTGELLDAMLKSKSAREIINTSANDINVSSGANLNDIKKAYDDSFGFLSGFGSYSRDFALGGLAQFIGTKGGRVGEVVGGALGGANLSASRNRKAIRRRKLQLATADRRLWKKKAENYKWELENFGFPSKRDELKEWQARLGGVSEADTTTNPYTGRKDITPEREAEINRVGDEINRVGDELNAVEDRIRLYNNTPIQGERWAFNLTKELETLRGESPAGKLKAMVNWEAMVNAIGSRKGEALNKLADTAKTLNQKRIKVLQEQGATEAVQELLQLDQKASHLILAEVVNELIRDSSSLGLSVLRGSASDKVELALLDVDSEEGLDEVITQLEEDIISEEIATSAEYAELSEVTSAEANRFAQMEGLVEMFNQTPEMWFESGHWFDEEDLLPANDFSSVLQGVNPVLAQLTYIVGSVLEQSGQTVDVQSLDAALEALVTEYGELLRKANEGEELVPPTELQRKRSTKQFLPKVMAYDLAKLGDEI